LDWYNHHRPHTGIGGQVPAARVTNLPPRNTSPVAAANRKVEGCSHWSSRKSWGTTDTPIGT